MKVVIYHPNHRFILENATMGLHGGSIVKTYDLKHATEDEKKQIRENPHNDLLLDEISKRGVR